MDMHFSLILLFTYLFPGATEELWGWWQRWDRHPAKRLQWKWPRPQQCGLKKRPQGKLKQLYQNIFKNSVIDSVMSFCLMVNPLFVYVAAVCYILMHLTYLIQGFFSIFSGCRVTGVLDISAVFDKRHEESLKEKCLTRTYKKKKSYGICFSISSG